MTSLPPTRATSYYGRRKGFKIDRMPLDAIRGLQRRCVSAICQTQPASWGRDALLEVGVPLEMRALRELLASLRKNYGARWQAATSPEQPLR